MQSMIWRLPNLNDPLTCLYAPHQPVPGTVEGIQKVLLAAIPNSDPDEADRSGWSQNEVQKVLIFADEDVPLRLGVPEYFNIGSLCQPKYRVNASRGNLGIR
jgi:hypothetical protein